MVTPFICTFIECTYSLHLDINECADDNGGCAQECINTQGSYFAAVEIDSHSLLTEQDALMMMVCHLVFLMYLRLLIILFVNLPFTFAVNDLINYANVLLAKLTNKSSSLNWKVEDVQKDVSTLKCGLTLSKKTLLSSRVLVLTAALVK